MSGRHPSVLHFLSPVCAGNSASLLSKAGHRSRDWFSGKRWIPMMRPGLGGTPWVRVRHCGVQLAARPLPHQGRRISEEVRPILPPARLALSRKLPATAQVSPRWCVRFPRRGSGSGGGRPGGGGTPPRPFGSPQSTRRRAHPSTSRRPRSVSFRLDRGPRDIPKRSRRPRSASGLRPEGA